MNRPDHCTDCSRALRDPGTPDNGAAVYAAKGKCRRCYYNLGIHQEIDAYAGITAQSSGHCRECRLPMRISSADPAAGVVVHQGRGFCSACYTRRKRAGDLPAGRPEPTEAMLREWRNQVEGIIRERRRRGVPPEGRPVTALNFGLVA